MDMGAGQRTQNRSDIKLPLRAQVYHTAAQGNSIAESSENKRGCLDQGFCNGVFASKCPL